MFEFLQANSKNNFKFFHIVTDGAIRRGESAKESDVDPHIKPKSVLAQTGGNALLPCRFSGPGIVSTHIG